MKLSELKPGDEIKYDQIIGLNDIETNIGWIIEITEECIIVQGTRDPKKILIEDLISGRARIIGLIVKGEENMAKGIQREDKAEKLEQAKKLMETGKTMNQTAKEIDVPVGTLSCWLKQEERKRSRLQNPKPVQVGRQEPEQEEEEPTKPIIPFSTERFESLGKTDPNTPEMGCPFDEPFFNPTPPVAMPIGCEMPLEKEKDFGPEDEEPIPYVPVKKEFSVDWFKLTIIDSIREFSWLAKSPDAITLAMISAILNVDYPEVR